jgi:hypothetical protein
MRCWIGSPTPAARKVPSRLGSVRLPLPPRKRWLRRSKTPELSGLRPVKAAGCPTPSLDCAQATFPLKRAHRRGSRRGGLIRTGKRGVGKTEAGATSLSSQGKVVIHQREMRRVVRIRVEQRAVSPSHHLQLFLKPQNLLLRVISPTA